MKKTLYVFAAILTCMVFVQAGENSEYPSYEPMIKEQNSWPIGEYWKEFKPGAKGYPFPKAFYFAEQGNYIRMNPKHLGNYNQTGILRNFIPGHWDLRYFDPEKQKASSPAIQKMVDKYLDNKWPIATSHYIVCRGRSAPTKAAIERCNEIWLGDGHPELPIYRLDFLFKYLHSGKWPDKGSSVSPDMQPHMQKLLDEKLSPRLEKELPFAKDPKHKWTHKELAKLGEIFCDEYVKGMIRPICWDMFVSPYYLASLPNVVCVGEKGADAFRAARARGVIRQSGGKKIFFTWRGHEPTEMYSYGAYRLLFSCHDRDEQGYPLPHLWHYIFRPYLIGANYSMIETFPGALIQDIEGDGTYQLSTLGYIVKDLFDYAERHPDRGVPYTPVGLLMDRSRNLGIGGVRKTLPCDDPYYMNIGLVLDLIFPEHRHAKNTGEYSIIAPYGEIFDILSPDPDKKIDPKVFDGYKVLFAFGGVELTPQYADALKKFVENGGTLVVNIKDLNKNLNPEFFGVKIAGKETKGEKVRNLISGKEFLENTFTFTPVKTEKAKILYSSGEYPIVTKNKVGKGNAILVEADYMIQDEKTKAVWGRWKLKWMKKKLLKFTADFLESLTAGLTPFDVRVRPEDKQDISWMVCKKGEGWTIYIADYSVERELVNRSVRTACAWARYPYKAIPFEIVCRASMKDVMELHDDRDVNYETVDGKITVKEEIRGDDMRIYEFQPHKIRLKKRERFVNYALNKPVKVSSTFKGYSPVAAVDGKRNNDDFWQSGLDKRNYNFAKSPQWIEVDLGRIETINHIFLQFHCWKNRSPEVRKHIYKYYVEASENGEKWKKIIDESKNEEPATPQGWEFWFSPVKARYVKLTVLRNSASSGAQVVEFAVMGKEKEMYQPKRKSIIPKWQVQWPESIKNVSKKKKYLIRIKPLNVKPGWLPPGKNWEEMNGWIKLYTDNSGKGGVFPKSIYGESVSEIVYAIPSRAEKFVSAIGLGNKSRVASVEFQVFVDGVKKFDSGLYRFGMPVLPVIVDVKGGKELKLVVTDGGDGIANDYAWWGDPYFIMK